MVFFVAVTCACSFVIEDGVIGSARWLNSLLVQQLSSAWWVAYVSQQVIFVVAWLLFASCCCCLHAWLHRLAWHLSYEWLVCSSCRHRAWRPCPHAWGDSSCCCSCHCCDRRCSGACAACIGHADGDNSCCCCIERTTLDSCAGRQNVAVCVCRARFATIDALAAIILVVVWVSLWYSQRPHYALVAFVNKAVVWLWGWLPQPSLLQLRDSSCEHFGISWWLRWLRPLRLAMALFVSIAIGKVVVACCFLLQLCIALMLTLHLQLRFY